MSPARLRPKTEAPHEGSWKIFVIGNECEELDDAWAVNVEVREYFTTEVQEKVRFLHDAGFVHGDIRRMNIVIKKNGKAGTHLTDFDWTGRIGTTTYPITIKEMPPYPLLQMPVQAPTAVKKRAADRFGKDEDKEEDKDSEDWRPEESRR